MAIPELEIGAPVMGADAEAIVATDELDDAFGRMGSSVRAGARVHIVSPRSAASRHTKPTTALARLPNDEWALAEVIFTDSYAMS